MRGPIALYKEWLLRLARSHVEDYYSASLEAQTVYLPFILLFFGSLGIMMLLGIQGDLSVWIMAPIGIFCLIGMIYGWSVYWSAKKRFRRELGLKQTVFDNG